MRQALTLEPALRLARTHSLPGDLVTPQRFRFVVGFFLAGFGLPYLGDVGRFTAVALFALLVFLLFILTVERQQAGRRFWLVTGIVIGGEIFFRDFGLKGTHGYLAVEYVLIAVCAMNANQIVDFLLRRACGTTLLWFGYCLWVVISLHYSADMVRGRWFASLPLSGFLLSCLYMEEGAGYVARRGLVEGILLGVPLGLGASLYYRLSRATAFAVATDERFGQGMVSPVQLGIQLCTPILLMVCSPYLPRLTWRSWATIAGLFAAAVVTFSRGPLLALAVAMLLYGIRTGLRGLRWHNIILGSLVLAGALGLLSSRYAEQTEKRYINAKLDRAREGIWGVSVELWRDAPVVGWGVGSWSTVFPKYSAASEIQAPARISDAHNMFMQALVETGLIGATFLLLFTMGMAWRALFEKASVCVLPIVAYVYIVGLFENWKLSVLYVLLGVALGDTVSARTRRLENGEAAQRGT